MPTDGPRQVDSTLSRMAARWGRTARPARRRALSHCGWS